MNLIQKLNEGRLERLMDLGHKIIITPAPRIHCNDGFNLSIQCSDTAYCSPRENRVDAGNYTNFEVGYPSERVSSLEPYAEEEGTTNTVYPYVPLHVLEALIEAHGGIQE